VAPLEALVRLGGPLEGPHLLEHRPQPSRFGQAGELGELVAALTDEDVPADEPALGLILRELGRLGDRGQPAAVAEQVEALLLDVAAQRIDHRVRADDLPEVAHIFERVTGAAASVDATNRRVTAPTESGVSAVGAVVAELERTDITVEDLGLHQPTLDDVFLTLTGAGVPAADEDEPQAAEPEGALR